MNLGREKIAGVLAMHDLSVVAMPEPWVDGGVDLFARENFLELLEQSAPA